MKRRYRLHKAFSLEPETIRTIEAKAVAGDDNNSRALDKIVAEWLLFTTDKQLPQQDNQEDLEAIKERLSRLEKMTQPFLDAAKFGLFSGLASLDLED